MKLNHIYSLVAGAVLMLGSCTPDDYDFGSAQYSVKTLSPRKPSLSLSTATGYILHLR